MGQTCTRLASENVGPTLNALQPYSSIVTAPVYDAILETVWPLVQPYLNGQVEQFDWSWGLWYDSAGDALYLVTEGDGDIWIIRL